MHHLTTYCFPVGMMYSHHVLFSRAGSRQMNQPVIALDVKAIVVYLYYSLEDESSIFSSMYFIAIVATTR